MNLIIHLSLFITNISESVAISISTILSIYIFMQIKKVNFYLKDLFN